MVQEVLYKEIETHQSTNTSGVSIMCKWYIIIAIIMMMMMATKIAYAYGHISEILELSSRL